MSGSTMVNYQQIIDAQITHRMNSNKESRIALKNTIRKYLDQNKYNLSEELIQVSLMYLNMFRDGQIFIEWLNKHKIGNGSLIFYKGLSKYYFCKQQYEKVISLLSGLPEKLLADKQIRKIRRISQTFLKISRTESLSQVSSLISNEPSQKLLAIQYEEQRYLYHQQNQFERYLQNLKQINPYLIMGQNQYIISLMINLLSPLQPIQVYYQYRNEVLLTQSIFIPNTKKKKIIYFEYTENLDQKDKIVIYNRSYEIQLQKELGQGGFGVVKSGKINNKSVAIKFYSRAKDNLQVIDYAISGSFLREAYILALLQQKDLKMIFHPRFYCGIISQRGQSILQQKLNGNNLYEIMKNNMKFKGVNTPCFTETQVINYFLQMLQIIEQLIQNNIVHCDCKIDNWILQNGQIYIVDFGKSVNLKLFQVQQSAVAFPADCLNSVSPSPSCKEIWSFEADFCALGSCLFSLVQGRLLTKEDTTEETNISMRSCKHMKFGVIIKNTVTELLNFHCSYDNYDQQILSALLFIEQQINKFSKLNN